MYESKPLPLKEALATVGWVLERKDIREDPVQVSLGVTHRGVPPVVSVAHLNGSAWRAGVNTGDELVAIDNTRIGDNLTAILRRYQPGDEVQLALFRAGALKTLDVTLDAILPEHQLESDEDANEATSARLSDWLGGLPEEDAEDKTEN